jgi:hypothetical protein
MNLFPYKFIENRFVINAMANPLLFITSCVMMAGHFLAVLFFKGPLLLEALYITGSITSLLNHGLTHAYAKWLDRLAMTAGLGLDIFFLCLAPPAHSGVLSALLSVALVGYVWGKALRVEGAPFHAFAHACILAEHICYLYFYDK